jgi:hypothetical protein
MKLQVKDATGLLHVSGKPIYRWISQAKLLFHSLTEASQNGGIHYRVENREKVAGFTSVAHFLLFPQMDCTIHSSLTRFKKLVLLQIS